MLRWAVSSLVAALLWLSLALPAAAQSGLLLGVESATAGGGGGGPWTPAVIVSQLPVWLDASDGATVSFSGTDVTAWANKGATAFSVTPNGGNSPQRVTSGLNGKVVFSYATGSGQKFISPGNVALSATTLTVVTVAKRSPTTTAAYQGIIGVNFGFATGFALGFVGNTQNNYNANDLLVSGAGDASTSPKAAAALSAATDTSYHLITGQVGATTALYQDGDSSVTAHYAATGTFTPISDLLYVGWTNNGGDFFDGFIAEILVCADCSSADVRRLEGYAAWKWGLQGALPSGHPYKSAAP